MQPYSNPISYKDKRVFFVAARISFVNSATITFENSINTHLTSFIQTMKSPNAIVFLCFYSHFNKKKTHCCNRTFLFLFESCAPFDIESAIKHLANLHAKNVSLLKSWLVKMGSMKSDAFCSMLCE